MTLLCVEDTKPLHTLYNSIFKHLVKEIIFADDGEEGYQKFLDKKVDIVITDYLMPKQNGLGMIEKIRVTDKNIPIILVSAIEDLNVIIKALQFGVNNFVKKPIVNAEIIHSVENASKLLIANDILERERNAKLTLLQEKETYSSYQEDLGFAKELNILRNDFYYQMINSSGISLVDFLYQPLDTMSGDAYSARRIDNHSTFYLMIDGMGKGLSASLTAMIMTSFVNHIFDKMIFLDNFNLGLLIHETIEYIKPILLEEEALSLDYMVIDYEENILYYSKFAMPALLMQNKNSEIIRLKSNNPPLSKYQKTFNMDSYDISDISKFLIYSDGIAENETLLEKRPYSEFIENDFLNSFTRKDFKNSFTEKIGTQEDDITLIFIHRLNLEKTLVQKRSFETSLHEMESASAWYSD
ncbi:MAG: response regulator receiver protein, partial [Helicobacteraceae bacterium CG2_30_36_10]